VIVSAAVEVFTGGGAPFTSVAAVIEYVPVRTLLGTLNGNETVCEVFGANVNGGVVNTTDLVLLQVLGCDGPFNTKLTTTVCVVLEHHHL